MIVIERPKDECQIFVAKGSGERYHFSCPSHMISLLYVTIKERNNPDLLITFIPRSCMVFELEHIFVINAVPKNLIEMDDEDLIPVHESICCRASPGSDKRSMKSIMIGLQTMYSHQQHLSRYCMLPHSQPHVLNIKQHSAYVRKAIMDSFQLACDTITEASHFKQPFSSDPICRNSDIDTTLFRKGLREDLYWHLLGDDIKSNHYSVDMGNIFESCTIQHMGKLGFHRDLMNCPLLDVTVAVHRPLLVKDNRKCISFLCYSRKCVGNFASRQQAIKDFLGDRNNCKLAKLCLKSLLATNGIYDYQGSLFEHVKSLNSLSDDFEIHHSTSCPEIREFTGLQCFKYGAAFDKMGYYSIYLNVFLSLHYMGLVVTVDDAISLSMYFGLLCNGTTNLAATWKDLQGQLQFGKDWHHKKTTSTKLFHLLVFIEKQRREKRNTNNELIGSCKLQQFQYSNYGSGVVKEADKIHSLIKDYLMQWRTGQTPTSTDACAQHATLFNMRLYIMEHFNNV
jgi:hypothetical protein